MTTWYRSKAYLSNNCLLSQFAIALDKAYIKMINDFYLKQTINLEGGTYKNQIADILVWLARHDFYWLVQKARLESNV